MKRLKGNPLWCILVIEPGSVTEMSERPGAFGVLLRRVLPMTVAVLALD